VNASDNYKAPYSTVAYTDPILLPSSSVGFLPNHAYHNMTWFNAYGQSKTGDFGYETPPQFPFRPQPVNMMSAWATVEPCVDTNNLINQMTTILCESFTIEPKCQGRVYQKSYPNYYDQLANPRGYKVSEFSKFSGEDGKPKEVMYEKSKEASQHLKPLYVWCHIDEMSISRMLVDDDTVVNLMMYSVFKKFGREDDELVKTKLMLNVPTLMFKCVNYTLTTVVNQRIKSKMSNFIWIQIQFKFRSVSEF
jgi:hypothetical protein